MKMANANGLDDLLGTSGATGTGPVSRLDGDDNPFLFGDAQNNNLTGDDGDNRIDAGAGLDIVRGGAGRDLLIGGDGADRLNGGVDDDVLIAGRDDDIVNAGAGDDLVRGGGGRDELRGQDGNDYINGGGGADQIFGGRNADILVGNVGNDFIHGGSGVDTAQYEGGVEEYTIALSEDGGSVTKTSGEGADEGVDTIRNVEILQFADARVLVVGADGFDTIQEAVDIAQDGDIIRIAAGTYVEQVEIASKEGLVLQGEGGGVVIKAPVALGVSQSGLPGPDGLVDAAGVVSVVNSRDIRIENLSIDGDDAGDAVPSGSATYFAGLLFVNSSGAADGLTIANVREPLDGGLPSNARTGDGIAIYNTDTLSRDVAVTNTEIVDFQKTGIRAHGEDLAVELDGNTISGAGLVPGAAALTQFGITVEAGAGGRIVNNTIGDIGTLRGDSPTAGVLLDAASDKIQVVGNAFNGVGADNAHTGIVVDGEVNDAWIKDNTFDGLLNGIAALNNVDGIKIDDNTFSDMLESVDTVANGSRPGLFTALSGAGNDDPGGNALVRFDGTEGGDLVQGSFEGDVIRTRGGDDLLDGLSGDDRLVGGEGDDTLKGGSQDDQLNGNGGSDLILGGTDEDVLRGGGGDDVLNGGAGEDLLIGGRGDDVITGGDGLDTYVFDADHRGEKTVTDFEAGETVGLEGFGFANVAAAQAAFSQVGDDVVFNAGDVTVTFEEAGLADVTGNLVLAAPVVGASATLERVGLASVDDGFENFVTDPDDGFAEIA